GTPLQWRNEDDLYYLGEQRGYVTLRAVRVRGSKSSGEVEATPGDRVVGKFSFVDSGVGVAVVGTSRTLPEIDMSSNFDGGRTLTNLNPQTATWKLPEVKHVTWKGANGDEVGGVLELPPDHEKGKPLPLIVGIHGGPTTAVYAGLEYNPYDGRIFLAAR